MPDFIVVNNIWPLNVYGDVSNDLLEKMINKPSLSEFETKLTLFETLKHIGRDNKLIENFFDDNIEYIDNVQRKAKRLSLIKK